MNSKIGFLLGAFAALFFLPGKRSSGEESLKPFFLPPGDASPGPADVSFLLDPPAGKGGFITVRDGRFHSGDRRIRFWGVNVCFAACFPSHEDAEKVAARLAKFGVNCVRFHHMDSSPFPRGIFRDRKLEELSPEALDRLDFFVAELARRGIYVNLNLHVSRWYSRAQGWPRAGDLPNYDKMVGIFHPELMAAQKRYARDLLTHKNSYTGRRYVEEPSLAMVEITNEDSLFMWGSLGRLPGLPEPYAGILLGKWNEWLLKTYGTDSRLREAWSRGEESLGEDQIRDPDFQTVLGRAQAERPQWSCEQHQDARANLVKGEGPEGEPAIRLEIEKITDVSWHIQFKQARLRVRKGRHYTVRFLARADREREIALSTSQDHEPWSNLGLSRTISLGRSWKSHRFGFVAGADDENGRISFSIGGGRAAVEIAAVHFQTGGRQGLAEEESLKSKNVALFPKGDSITEVRRDDGLRFLRDTEREYFLGLRNYLKDELGLRVPVTGTIGYGSLGTQVQAELDFVDQHAYWQHPRFPRRPWDSRDWNIRNIPMSGSPSGGTLPHLASTRVLGKPYTVTEYNHPAPLDSQAETIPLIAGFAAWQDWDGVFLFAYNHSGRFDRDHLQSFFDIDGNPAKMGFLGAGALVFLGARLKPAAELAVTRLTEEDAVQAALPDPAHLEPFLVREGFSMEALLKKRWAVSFGGRGPLLDENAPDGQGSLSWIGDRGRERFVIDGPAVKAICGRIGGRIDLDGVSLDITEPVSASLLLASKDGAPIRKATSLLLAACGRCENTGMGWNEDRTSVGDRWGTAPCRIEVVKGMVIIEGDPLRQVISLDGRGQKLEELPLRSTEKGTSFTIGDGPPTLWYELCR